MPKNILVIDDEEIVVNSLKKLLEREGYCAEIASSGLEALERVKEGDFDLIISDIRMQDMDGIETVKNIREYLKNNNKNSVPEILITGYASDDTFKEAQKLKVADYIYKPFDTNNFLKSVSKNIK